MLRCSTSSWFTGGNATVIVTMDENDQQSSPAGGQVPFVVISSRAKGAGAVATHGNLFGALRSIEEVFGLPLLGGAQSPSNGDSSGTSADLVDTTRLTATDARAEGAALVLSAARE